MTAIVLRRVRRERRQVRREHRLREEGVRQALQVPAARHRRHLPGRCSPTTTPRSPSARIAAAKNPAYKERLDRAVAFLKKLQWVPNGEKGPKGETVNDPKNPWYGGWGYGNHARPDLSNAHFSIEALHDAGLKRGRPGVPGGAEVRHPQPEQLRDQRPEVGRRRRRLHLRPRHQRRGRQRGRRIHQPRRPPDAAQLRLDDLRRPQEHDLRRPDEGRPARQGGVGLDPQELDAGRKPRHAAEQARRRRKHGLFYYYHTLARALNAYDEPVITDAKGAKHDWRAELIEKLAAQQQPDGTGSAKSAGWNPTRS